MWFTVLFAKLFRLFRRKRHLKVGFYGPPNGGKTTLANRVCADWLGEEIGSTSRIAHETRQIQFKHGIRIVDEDGKTLLFSLVDTPGISSRIDYEDFVRQGIAPEEAKVRAKEAATGVVESVEWLGTADVLVVILDATKEPLNQVTTTLLANIKERGIPVFIIANKIDLKSASVERVMSAFPEYDVIGISAKYGDNVERFYERLFEITAQLRG